jgi:hypothetical protein
MGSLHNELLAQARLLATKEPKHPLQASLRRAVSAAYYSVFHLLVDAGGRSLTKPGDVKLRHQLQRAHNHGSMKLVCQNLNQLNPLVTFPLEPQLIGIANAFVNLQQARHDADYDYSITFIRTDVLQKIALADTALLNWKAVRNTSNARAFLAALLLQRHWRG